MSYRSRTATSNSSSSRKSHSEKNQQILKQLAKKSQNKHCADCKTATNPRWASWNLGIFICIRCSGIHRSMGTHISKVKSIDLDSWTDDQVQSMVNWGNEKANIYWEHNLPKNHIPDDSKIQNFIRTKYEMKKWVSTKYLPDPSTIKGISDNDSTAANILATNLTPTTIHANKPKTIAATATTNSDVFDLLGGFDSSNTSTPSSVFSASDAQEKALPPLNNNKPIPQAPQPSSSATNGLLSLNFNGASSSQAAASQSSINTGRQSNRPDLKKSILALYSTPSAANSAATSFGSGSLYSQPVTSTNNINQFNGSIAGINNSLAGLNLSSSSTATNTNTTTNNNNTTDFSNIWNSSPSLLNNSTTTTKNQKSSLDDDLFKNVWS